MSYLQAAVFILLNGDVLYPLVLSAVVGVFSYGAAVRSGELNTPPQRFLFWSSAVMLGVLYLWGVAWMPTSGRHGNPGWASDLILAPLATCPILATIAVVRLKNVRVAASLFGAVNVLCCLFVALVSYMAVSSYWL
ncbi:MAG: hypothetical protein WA840_08885 [Caulobacteraceae bacterium]